MNRCQTPLQGDVVKMALCGGKVKNNTSRSLAMQSHSGQQRNCNLHYSVHSAAEQRALRLRLAAGQDMTVAPSSCFTTDSSCRRIMCNVRIFSLMV